MIKKVIELHELTAAEGMTLTNGDVFSKKIYLGCNDTAENWREITDEEAAELQEAKEAEQMEV